MDRDGAGLVECKRVVEFIQFGKKYIIPVEYKDGKYISPFRTLENPDAYLYRGLYQDIKKAVRGCMEDSRYAGQKEELLKKGIIKTQGGGGMKGRISKKIIFLTIVTVLALAVLAGVFWYSRRGVVNEENIIKPETNYLGLFLRKALGSVGKSEGYEHGFIRQLVAEPERFQFTGDKEDIKAVTNWAGKKAHQIAILAGYVDQKTGREIRVRYADRVSVFLDVDERGSVISVSEYEEDENGDFKDIPTQANNLASNYNDAKFLGDSPDGVQSYEYVYQPQP